MRAREEAIGRPVADLEIDFAALERLARGLRELAGELSDREGSLQQTLADADLAAALRHAERDWWNQRRALRSFLDGVATNLYAGMQQYEWVERDIWQAAGGVQR
jgi:hypothetical protein